MGSIVVIGMGVVKVQAWHDRNGRNGKDAGTAGMPGWQACRY